MKPYQTKRGNWYLGSAPYNSIKYTAFIDLKEKPLDDDVVDAVAECKLYPNYISWFFIEGVWRVELGWVEEGKDIECLVEKLEGYGYETS